MQKTGLHACLHADVAGASPADAHPLDLLVFLDMNSGRVLETQMQPSPPAIPQMNFNYLAGLVHQERGTRTGKS